MNTPFTGTVKFNEVSLAGAQKFLNAQALENSDAVITGSTDFSTGGGKASAKGSLKLNDAVIHGVQVGYPIEADFNIADDLNADVMQISKFALKLGSTPVSVNWDAEHQTNIRRSSMSTSTRLGCLDSGDGTAGLGFRSGLQPGHENRWADHRQGSRARANRSSGLERQR